MHTFQWRRFIGGNVVHDVVLECFFVCTPASYQCTAAARAVSMRCTWILILSEHGSVSVMHADCTAVCLQTPPLGGLCGFIKWYCMPEILTTNTQRNCRFLAPQWLRNSLVPVCSSQAQQALIYLVFCRSNDVKVIVVFSCLDHTRPVQLLQYF